MPFLTSFKLICGEFSKNGKLTKSRFIKKDKRDSKK